MIVVDDLTKHAARDHRPQPEGIVAERRTQAGIRARVCQRGADRKVVVVDARDARRVVVVDAEDEWASGRERHDGRLRKTTSVQVRVPADGASEKSDTIAREVLAQRAHGNHADHDARERLGLRGRPEI